MSDTATYRPIVDAILEAMPDVKVPKGMDVGLKFTSPTQTTYDGFAWPNPGKWTVDFGEDWNPTPCAGGGVHAATTIEAAQSGGHRFTHAMLVCWRPSEAATSYDEPGKVKARRIKTLCRIDMRSLLVADLYLAYLARADLTGADLTGAYLAGADLSGADLTGADLARANLAGAYLAGADLARANLAGAYLAGADLTGADLTGAYLAGADLAGADLAGADLAGAYLSGADLTGAKADKWTRWPIGFHPVAAGVQVIT